MHVWAVITNPRQLKHIPVNGSSAEAACTSAVALATRVLGVRTAGPAVEVALRVDA